MNVKNKTEALAALSLLSQDMEMLKAGDWVPDNDSCDASLEVIEALRKFVASMVESTGRVVQ